MKWDIERERWQDLEVDCIVVGIYKNQLVPRSLATQVDERLGGAVARLFQAEEFKSTVGATRLISTLGQIAAPYVLVVGLGTEKKPITLESLRRAGASICPMVKTIAAKSIAIELLGKAESELPAAHALQAIAEGLQLAAYQYDALKSEKKPFPLVHARVLVGAKNGEQGPPAKTAALEKALEVASALSDATMWARDLVNTPPRDMTPQALAAAAKKIKGVHVKVLHRPDIEALKMGAYLSVADGAKEPPAFIEMTYTPPQKAKKVLALVGKGVTFDSGGLSLKPAKSMETMKCDMAGAAAVIAFMRVLADLKPAIEVRGYVAATENMVDGGATKPGDVVRAMSGKTIEVLNTDAEGRLTLADALHYAVTRPIKPHYIIDMATLTGACLVALGERCTAAMGTAPELIEKLKHAGENAGEMIWELPLIEDYAEDLKSTVADLQNTGGRYAGTITGGLFLKEFVGDTKWVHLDIAGSAWTDKPLSYCPKGGTGAMVRTLWELIKSL